MPLARDHVTAEIVFPVASDAVTQDPDSEFGGIVPGVSGGEGCSTAGGCATCPFMKMNDLDAVLDIAETIRDGDVSSLAGHHPPNRIAGKMLGDREAVDVGVDSIMHMRHLMSEGRFSDELVQEVKQRSAI
jgi:quinolinate synthase